MQIDLTCVIVILLCIPYILKFLLFAVELIPLKVISLGQMKSNRLDAAHTDSGAFLHLPYSFFLHSSILLE